VFTPNPQLPNVAQIAILAAGWDRVCVNNCRLLCAGVCVRALCLAQTLRACACSVSKLTEIFYWCGCCKILEVVHLWLGAEHQGWSASAVGLGCGLNHQVSKVGFLQLVTLL
jgi:hypothetical protein